MFTVHWPCEVAPVEGVVLPAGQAAQLAGLGVRVVPPELNVPLVQAEQVLPAVPAAQMPMLQDARAVEPTALVVKVLGHDMQEGLGTVLFPPVA